MKHRITKVYKRIIAGIIDGGLFFLLLLIQYLFLELGYYWQILGNIIYFAIEYLYFVEYVFRKGNTIGKRIEGMRVVSYNGEELSRYQCALRYLSYSIFGVVFFVIETFFILQNSPEGYADLGLLGKSDFVMSRYPTLSDIQFYLSIGLLFIHFIFILLQKERRSLADFIAGTVVVE